jgi:hypothetical protein
MTEQHYYADVNLPFHVWVRERAGTRGYRWVLRNAAEMGAPGNGRNPEAANDSGRPAPKRSAG